jgi:hypothetical protein
MDRPLRLLPALGLALGGFLLGLFVHAQFGTSSNPPESSIQVALIAGSVALTVAIIGLGGVVIGAAAAAQASRDARLDEQRLGRFAKALELCEKHSHDVAQQVASRADAARNGTGPETVKPDVGSTDPAEEAIHALYLFAEQKTADQAWAMLQAAIVLSQYAFDAKKHVVSGQVVALIPEQTKAHRDAQVVFKFEKTKFIDAVRRETGQPALEGSTTS